MLVMMIVHFMKAAAVAAKESKSKETARSSKFPGSEKNKKGFVF